VQIVVQKYGGTSLATPVGREGSGGETCPNGKKRAPL
jgi:hypothetical protein